MASKSLPTLSAAIVPLLAGLLFTPGCSDDAGPGHIVIPYKIGAGLSCDDLGVTKVRATLTEDISDDAPCENGEVRIDDVPPGSYDLLLQGLDGNGVAIVDNGAHDDRVEIIGDGSTVTADEINMSLAPAKLWIRWDFDYVTCDTVDFTDIEIEAYANGGGLLLHDSSFDCDADPEEGMSGYHLFEDDSRNLVGDALDTVIVAPVDASGAPVGPEMSFSFEPVGHGYPVEISLRCDENGCDCSEKNADDECVLD
jgi:hypothetical protein